MPRIRRGVELTRYELNTLVRELTAEQRYELIDSGWLDDPAAAVEFVMRRSPELRGAWEERHEFEARLGAGWLPTLARMFWYKAVPLLVANPRELDPPQEAAAALSPWQATNVL